MAPPVEPRTGEASPRGTRFGPFILDSRLAVGGTAEVYLAHPADATSAFPPSLVVKRLLPTFAMDPEGRQMFDREANLHAQVHHPNVVKIFTSGTSEAGEPYLAMEYIPGVDGFRLVRKLRLENRPVPQQVALHIALETLKALDAVHSASGPNGVGLGIVHRDISPSNIYIARDGHVKVGDFGIARSLTRRTLNTDPSQGVKGKFGYLAPEQVAGEASDHRADLFSLGNVLAEMLLGQPLFPGNGQLAVLLAIRDVRTDALDHLKQRFPAPLVSVLGKALSRDPQKRYPDARMFLAALEVFQGDVALARAELAALVKATESTSSTASLNAVRASVSAMRAVRPSSGQMPAARPADIAAVAASSAAVAQHMASLLPLVDAPTGQHVLETHEASKKRPGIKELFDLDDEEEDTTNRFTPEDLGLVEASRRTAPPPPSSNEQAPTRPPPGSEGPAHVSAAPVSAGHTTKEVELLPSFLVYADGRRVGPLSFSRLVEEISTGKVSRQQLVDYMGRGSVALALIPELARLMPPPTPAPQSPAEAVEPAFSASLSETPLYEVLLRMFLQADKGLLIVESGPRRKELWIDDRRLQYVTSNDTSELFGEMLVSWGKLQRHELDMALAVLPKFNGRLGDTLIGLGLCEAMDVFHAIREQGRDRVGDMFNWREGAVRFFPDAVAPTFEFAQELPLTDIIVRGLELSTTSEEMMMKYSTKWRLILVALEEMDPEMLETNLWPPAFPHVLGFIDGKHSLAQVVESAAVPDELTVADVLRILDVLLAVNAVWWAY